MGGRVGVAVVGAGVMGAAAAEALARTGRDVVLLEQFELGHRRGSSHGATRIFRLTYNDPYYVRLAQTAYEGWRRLERDSGAELLELNGLLEIAPDLGPFRAALDACGVEWEELDARAAEERFGVRLPDGTNALLQPQAGVAFADRARETFVARAEAQGARVRAGARVLAVEPADGVVRIRLDSGELECEAVVVAAGAWAPALLEPLGIDLAATVTRETVAYFRVQGRPPSVIDETAGEIHGYALRDPVHGLKAGFHKSGGAADPDADAEPDAELLAAIVAWAAERFDLEDPEPAATDTCLYTNRVDDHFALERHGRVVVGSPCSGHGFKFAPAIGEQLAALAAEVLD